MPVFFFTSLFFMYLHKPLKNLPNFICNIILSSSLFMILVNHDMQGKINIYLFCFQDKRVKNKYTF